ncbi:MAG: IS1096 element passenger TnpR family protein [Bdellovibrionales bacterium]
MAKKQSPAPVYTFKVSLMDVKGVWRWVQIPGNATLHDLNDLLCDAFDRHDPHHLYRFYNPGIDTTSMRKILNAPDIYEHPEMDAHGAENNDSPLFGMVQQLAESQEFDADVMLRMLQDDFPEQTYKDANQTTIESIALKPKDVLFLEFDMITEWWHRIRLEAIDPANTSGAPLDKKGIVIKRKGESPPQYDDAIGGPDGGEIGHMAVYDFSDGRPRMRWIAIPPEVLEAMETMDEAEREEHIEKITAR